MSSVDDEIAHLTFVITLFLPQISEDCALPPAGIVNLPRVRRHDGRRDDCSESDRRILGDFGEFAPRDEPGSELFAIE